jgi:hypothetical protein
LRYGIHDVAVSTACGEDGRCQHDDADKHDDAAERVGDCYAAKAADGCE